MDRICAFAAGSLALCARARTLSLSVAFSRFAHLALFSRRLFTRFGWFTFSFWFSASRIVQFCVWVPLLPRDGFPGRLPLDRFTGSPGLRLSFSFASFRIVCLRRSAGSRFSRFRFAFALDLFAWFTSSFMVSPRLWILVLSRLRFTLVSHSLVLRFSFSRTSLRVRFRSFRSRSRLIFVFVCTSLSFWITPLFHVFCVFAFSRLDLLDPGLDPRTHLSFTVTFAPFTHVYVCLCTRVHFRITTVWFTFPLYTSHVHVLVTVWILVFVFTVCLVRFLDRMDHSFFRYGSILHTVHTHTHTAVLSSVLALTLWILPHSRLSLVALTLCWLLSRRFHLSHLPRMDRAHRLRIVLSGSSSHCASRAPLWICTRIFGSPHGLRRAPSLFSFGSHSCAPFVLLDS